MKVIGFNLTKISGERFPKYERKTPPTINVDITSIEKDSVEMLKDSEALRILFKHVVFYTKDIKSKDKEAEVSIEGVIVVSASKDEVKDVLKEWKKKQLPDGFRSSIYNLIFQKCTPRTISLQDEIGLPSHIPLPRYQIQQKDSPKN